MRSLLTTCTAVILSFFLFVPLASAQSLGNQPDPLRFLVAPDVPEPGDEVLIEAQGVGTFLGDATITWQIDGKTVKSGLGERQLSFTLGDLGSQTKVRATVDSPTRGVIVKDFTFLPSTVKFVWEAQTSAPPWYRGKALYSAGSTLTVTAFPQVIVGGKSLAPNNLSYQWKRNNTPITEQSGKGRNTLSFKGSQLLAGESVSVDVQAGTLTVAHGEITIPAQNPAMLLYIRDPLRGVLYDQALTNGISLNGKEITLQAEPYYFSTQSLEGDTVQYDWTLNNKTITGPDTTRGILTLRQSGTGAGTAILGVKLQNTDPDKYVQAAKTSLQILFGGTSSAGTQSFFGL